MPCVLKIKVIEARNLPVMDKNTELADAFVEVCRCAIVMDCLTTCVLQVRFSDLVTQKTPIARKTLNPVWNADFV